MLTIFIAGWLAFFLRFGETLLPNRYLIAIFFGVLLTPILFTSVNLYTSARGKKFLNHLGDLIQAVAMLTIFMAGMSFFTKLGQTFSRIWFSEWMLLSLFLLITLRCGLLLLLRYMRRHGMNEKRIVIITKDLLCKKVVETIQQSLWTGFRITLIMDDEDNNLFGIPVIRTPENLSAYFADKNIDEIWLSLPLSEEQRVQQILNELRLQTVTVRLILDVFGMSLVSHKVTDIAGFATINIFSSPIIGINHLIKSIEDRLLAAIIVLLISPLLLAIAIAIKLTSPGPVFYRQKRVGWNGQEFEMLKFRSMPVNAEEKSGPVWASKDDNRPTTIGRFLRRTSLDELPQFLNVLKGDMSIVGPRPERKVFVDEFKKNVPHYMQKHLVNAGITGWAQVNGWRGNTSLEKRIEYDLYYIENWSLMFDLKIIFLTVFRGFVNRNAY